MFDPLLIIIYWSTFLLCLSSYLFYPLALFLLNTVRGKTVCTADQEPRVSILIAAYNEEKDITRKIANCLELDYPADKLEILVGSDGSTDETVSLGNSAPVGTAQGFRLFREQGKNLGAE